MSSVGLLRRRTTATVGGTNPFGRTGKIHAGGAATARVAWLFALETLLGAAPFAVPLALAGVLLIAGTVFVDATFEASVFFVVARMMRSS
jgi:hypothetical protein